MKKTTTAVLALVAGLGLAAAARAQEPPPAAPEKAASEKAAPAQKVDARPVKLLRVQIVLSRFLGEKKVTSLPYTVLASTDRRNASLRMGVEVPVAVATGSVQYRNVGTNIDCRADERGDGLYQLELKAENSSVYTGPGTSEASARVEDRPIFRSFNVSISPVMRDGQSIQTIASTDPVTGEVVKIDLTLNVVK